MSSRLWELLVRVRAVDRLNLISGAKVNKGFQGLTQSPNHPFYPYRLSQWDKKKDIPHGISLLTFNSLIISLKDSIEHNNHHNFPFSALSSIFLIPPGIMRSDILAILAGLRFSLPPIRRMKSLTSDLFSPLSSTQISRMSLCDKISKTSL